MLYKIDARYEPDYLYVQVSGIRFAEDEIFLIKDILQAGEKHNCKKLLVDARSMSGKLSLIDYYQLGEEAPDKIGGIHSEYKTAIVDLEENRERFRFVEDVLVNRLFNLRFFSNTVDAERWLRQSK